jgi:glycosyltransferase involved in cell wall biosynthesis
MPRLSLIAPCDNCEETVEAAVEFAVSRTPVFAFDVTLVGDGSTDSTGAVMQDLARRNRSICLPRHDTNRGGVASNWNGASGKLGSLPVRPLTSRAWRNVCMI